MYIKTYRQAAATSPMSTLIEDDLIYNEIFAFSGKPNERLLLSEIKSTKAPFRARYAATLYPFGMSGSIVHLVTDSQYDGWNSPAGNNLRLWVTVMNAYADEVQERGMLEIEAGEHTLSEVYSELANLDLLDKRVSNGFSFVESIHYAITCLRVDRNCKQGLFGGSKARIIPAVGLWDKTRGMRQILSAEQYLAHHESEQHVVAIQDILAYAQNAYMEITETCNPVEQTKAYYSLIDAIKDTDTDMYEELELENITEEMLAAYDGEEDGDYEGLNDWIMQELKERHKKHVFRGVSGDFYVLDKDCAGFNSKATAMTWED